MSEETEGTDTGSPAVAMEIMPVADTPAASGAALATPRRGGWLALLIALVALLLAGYAVWRDVARERGDANVAAQVQASFGERLDRIEANQAQQKREVATQRARMNDADSVNHSVREELLNLTERSRHVEDAVANLAEQRLTGRDALALNEAEFLLQLGAERLALFHDAGATLAAYRLADSALAAAEDPVFASVRQTIAAETRSLTQARPLETRATLDTLERVRAALAELPVKPNPVSAPPAAGESRLLALLHQFVRVSHDQAVAPDARDVELARDLAAIDLRAAEAALLARDPQTYVAALVRVRAELSAHFDPAAPALTHALGEINRLAGTPMAPDLPELGSALTELRNLRATRALSRGNLAPAGEPATGAPPPKVEPAPTAPAAPPQTERTPADGGHGKSP